MEKIRLNFASFLKIYKWHLLFLLFMTSLFAPILGIAIQKIDARFYVFATGLFFVIVPLSFLIAEYVCIDFNKVLIVDIKNKNISYFHLGKNKVYKLSEINRVYKYCTAGAYYYRANYSIIDDFFFYKIEFTNGDNIYVTSFSSNTLESISPHKNTTLKVIYPSVLLQKAIANF